MRVPTQMAKHHSDTLTCPLQLSIAGYPEVTSRADLEMQGSGNEQLDLKYI